jgi:hypothetical protein
MDVFLDAVGLCVSEVGPVEGVGEVCQSPNIMLVDVSTWEDLGGEMTNHWQKEKIKFADERALDFTLNG